MATATQRSERRKHSATAVDLDTLMKIKSLELRAKIIVQGFMSGLHRSPYHGFSVEFSEYRQYSPGDDPRYLDWKLFARSDRYYIKRFEDETNLRCMLLVDQSRSMGFTSVGHSKADYAVTLAATLGYFLTTQRDAVGLVTFDEKVEDYLPARFRPGHLHRVILALERPLAGTATDIAAPLQHIAELSSKRGLMILISDLLAPIETLETNLKLLRSRGHEVVLFQILDPAEMTLSFTEPAVFHDMETGRDIYVDPATASDEYRRALSNHIDRISAACQLLGIRNHLIQTNQPLETALADYLRSRMEQGSARQLHHG